ncbi:MAG: VCBS repeat-containing protein [Armatimonadetes bacterium]|nr:VCBS repeat-containing protein [Armatimonadota bacterium]
MEQSGVWITRGFESFSQGTLGNAGQNLYVSRGGVLQRLHQYDFNKDGYVDLIFCNSQDHCEKPPVYVYRNALTDPVPQELPAEGARSGAVADLNGDGYDDLVLGMMYDGIRQDLNAVIYYGGPEGWGESRHQKLPAPSCCSVAIGDFNGEGRPDLAFLCGGRVRVFYQSGLGFEPKRFVDLEITGDQLGACDLDGDGFSDLVVRSQEGTLKIYWGGPEGLNVDHADQVPIVPKVKADSPGESAATKYPEYVAGVAPLAQVVLLGGLPHLFRATVESVYLVPVIPDRSFGPPLILSCARSTSVAVGDVNGDGYPDLVFSCLQPGEGGERSWIYWGGERGFDETRRSSLPTRHACDVAVCDLDGDGCDDIVFCQAHTPESFTTESLIYSVGRDGETPEPVRLLTHDPRRVFVARPSRDKEPHLVFVNHCSRGLLGDVDVSVYYGGPQGFDPERRKDLPGWGAVEAVCCDVNDDGYVDLVLANASENSVDRDPGSYVILNGPEGFADAPAFTLPTTRAHGVCCADLNRDGYLDLVFCGFDNPDLLIFYGTAQGFDTANPQRIRMEHDGVVYKEPRWIYLADLNNDGWLDLVVPQIVDDRSFILWGGPEGFSMERCQMLSVVRGACARAADLTGNGYLDLIVGGHIPSTDGPHDSYVNIYWSSPEGLREDRRTLLPANAVNSMTVADFNNDGRLDLFVCSYHDGRTRDLDSYIYWNREGRGFSAMDRSRLFTHSASGCVAADFNEDGWVDLAVANHKVEGDHVGYSALWWNGPEGFSERNVTRLPTVGPHGMTAVGPGNLMDRGPEEFYVSAPFQLPHGSCVRGISWQAEVPPKTWVKAQLRFADTREDLERATWRGPAGAGTWFDRCGEVRVKECDGEWVQYRLALGAVNGGCTPRVTEVCVEYDGRVISGTDEERSMSA